MQITLDDCKYTLGDSLGLVIPFTTDAAGESDGSTVCAAELADYPDDALASAWIEITSGDCDGEIRRVSRSFTSEGTARMLRPFSAQVAISVTGRLYLVNPNRFTRFINSAIKQAWPYLCDLVEDQTLVGQNLLKDGNLEEWDDASNLTYWTTQTCTLARTTGLFGSYCAKLDTAAGYIYVSSDDDPRLLSLENSDARCHFWCKSSVASSARIMLYTKKQDGTEDETQVSAYHSGSGEWENIEVDDLTVPDDLAEVQLRLYIGNAGDTVYYDNVRLYGPTISEYLLPTAITELRRVQEIHNADTFLSNYLGAEKKFETFMDGGVRWLRTLEPVSWDNFIRLKGGAPISALSADTDYITVDDPIWEKIIAYGAAAELLRSNAMPVSVMSTDKMTKDAEKYEARFEKMKKQFAVDLALVLNKRGVFE